MPIYKMLSASTKESLLLPWFRKLYNIVLSFLDLRASGRNPVVLSGVQEERPSAGCIALARSLPGGGLQVGILS